MGLGHFVLPLSSALESGTGTFLHEIAALHMLLLTHDFTSFLLCLFLSFYLSPPLPPSPPSFPSLLASSFSGMVTCGCCYRDSKAAIRSWIMGL